MPSASPWQRSHAVWHKAGTDWVHSGTTKRRTEPRRAGEPRQATESAPAPVPPLPQTPRRRSRISSIRVPSGRGVLVVAGVAVILVGGAGAYVLSSGDDKPGKPGQPAAVAAENLFAPDPAAKTDGLVQELTAVVGAGDTAVAYGSETGGPDRAEFLVSSDGGRAWRLARVRAAGGAEPPPGEFPRKLAGGSGAWAALGGPLPAPAAAVGPGSAGPGTGAVSTVWTSRDGSSWTREAAGSAFGSGDRVNSLARTSGGFVAVGVTSPAGTFKDTTKAVVWTSGDGRAWQRSNVPMISLDRVAAAGNVLVAQGSAARTVSSTVKQKGRKKTVKKTVVEPGLVRSADGGRTWTAVNVPQAQGSYGFSGGLVAGPGGLYTVREGQRTTGSKKSRKTVRFAVVFSSADGSAWAPSGTIAQGDYVGPARLAGSSTGLAVLARTGSGKIAALRSADARTWTRAGDLPAARTVAGVTLLPAGVVAVGRNGDDAYMTAVGAGDVDLTKVPGAVRPERSVNALAQDTGTPLLALGSSNADAAVWLSGDNGRTWSRGTGPDLGGAGRQWLFSAAHGAPGWVAVGRTAPVQGPAAPLVLTSSDGTAWRRAPGFPGAAGPSVNAVAYGPGGYVIVGRSGTSAATWSSTDLKTWTRGGNAGKGDLDGLKQMRAVTSVASGYVAVGAQSKDAAGVRTDHPAIWTSPDAKKWTAVPAPPPLPAGATTGALNRVIAKGTTLVALGTAATSPTTPSYGWLAVSRDGGTTWQSPPLPGGGPQTTVTTLTTTARGFLVGGTTGQPGAQNVALWTSPDAATWTRTSPEGTGLNGQGDQRLTALLAQGPALLATGTTTTHTGQSPTLWHPPTP